MVDVGNVVPGIRLIAVKTLFLLRHAKSSWSDPAVADRDRPLAPRGRRAAKRMARHLASTGVRPERVWCSSARRARETLELVRAALGAQAEVRVTRRIYDADAADLVGLLRRVDDGVTSVMIIGHNPAVQDLAVALSGGGDQSAISQLHAKFPTGALATLDVGGWAQLGPGQARLTSLVVPRRLT